MISRRQFGALSAGLLLPRRLLAAADGEQQLLFIFCAGGWDQTAVFAPLFDSSSVDMEPEAVSASAGGITFVDHEERPAVRSFFEDWGPQTCLINGFEVRAISHEQCTRLLMTGSSGAESDDWAVLAAGSAAPGLLMPHVVVSGPAFSSQYSSKVVRIGASGQLPGLIDGSALQRSEQPVDPMGAQTQSLVDAFMRERAAALSAVAGRGQEQRYAESLSTVLSQAESLSGYADRLQVEINEQTDMLDQLEVALSCLQEGLTRTAMIQYDGIWGVGWDTHSDNWYQSLHFEELFGYLSRLMTELSSRTAADGRQMSEAVTVVVVSEMGRSPQLNNWGGRHHWTYTSAMLMGAGIAGGQVIGGYDPYAIGQSVRLSDGVVSDSGTPLVSGHLGATVLALAGIDPGDLTGGLDPITAALR
jgi:uncharacterized protein (DUF1501 family)